MAEDLHDLSTGLGPSDVEEQHPFVAELPSGRFRAIRQCRVTLAILVLVTLLGSALVIIFRHGPGVASELGGDDEVIGKNEVVFGFLHFGSLPTVYCFEVFRVGHEEARLVTFQIRHSASIFGCDSYDLFCTGSHRRCKHFTAKSKAGQLVRAKSLHRVKASKYGKPSKGDTTASWLNTEVFIYAWDTVVNGSKWRRADWTVKVDPDSVFFPERLKYHLNSVSADARGTMLENCGLGEAEGSFGVGSRLHNAIANVEYEPKHAHYYSAPSLQGSGSPGNALYGPIEVFSQGAMHTYAVNDGEGPLSCKAALKWHSYGEDTYMQMCLELLQVRAHIDTHLMSQISCGEEASGSNTSAGHNHTGHPGGSGSGATASSPEPEPEVLPPDHHVAAHGMGSNNGPHYSKPNCSNAELPVFHPLKSLSKWEKCWLKARRAR